MIVRPRLDDVVALLSTLTDIPVTVFIQCSADGSWSYTGLPTENSARIDIDTTSRKQLRKIVRRALDSLEARQHDNKRESGKHSTSQFGRTEDKDDTESD